MTRSESLYELIMIAGIGGFFVPVLLPVCMYIWGKMEKNELSMRSSVAIAQATIVSWVIIAVYKIFTGRVEPQLLTTYGAEDTSRNFQFGFLEHGIFFGWGG